MTIESKFVEGKLRIYLSGTNESIYQVAEFLRKNKYNEEQRRFYDWIDKCHGMNDIGFGHYWTYTVYDLTKDKIDVDYSTKHKYKTYSSW